MNRASSTFPYRAAQCSGVVPSPERVMISPGPGTPDDAWPLVDVAEMRQSLVDASHCILVDADSVSPPYRSYAEFVSDRSQGEPPVPKHQTQESTPMTAAASSDIVQQLRVDLAGALRSGTLLRLRHYRKSVALYELHFDASIYRNHRRRRHAHWSV